MSKSQAVGCSNCGWKGEEKDLTKDHSDMGEGRESCPNCRQGYWWHIYDLDENGEPAGIDDQAPAPEN